MKQVIVRLRDCRTNRIKTIRKRYYYSKAQYEFDVYDDFKDLMPGQEICVKFGNQHEEFITYEEVFADAETDKSDFDYELYYRLTMSCNITHYLEQYLPRY